MEVASMDIMQLRREPHLSASSINDFLDCSLMFKFSRIDKIKTESTSDALVLGSCVHQALAKLNESRILGNKLPLEVLQQEFEKQWKGAAEGRSDIEYRDGEDFQSVLQKGKDLLDAYYKSLSADDFQVIAIEEPFILRIPGLPVPIIGIFDLVEEDESGTIIIVDFKTSSKAYSSDAVDKNLQLTLYHMAIKANGYQDREILLRFDCLIKTKTPKFEQYYTTRSEIDERRAAKKILTVWQAINQKVFIPNDTSWKCNGCAFGRYCEEWFSNEE
jgi:putative RecB family exonuclease